MAVLPMLELEVVLFFLFLVTLDTDVVLRKSETCLQVQVDGKVEKNVAS